MGGSSFFLEVAFCAAFFCYHNVKAIFLEQVAFGSAQRYLNEIAG
jgi:hypothetical protein